MGGLRYFGRGCPSSQPSSGQRRSSCRFPESGAGVRRRGRPSSPSCFSPCAAASASWRGGRPSSGLADFRGASYFPTTEVKGFCHRSPGGARVNLLQLLGSRRAPFWGGRPQWSISRRCRNGRTYLASSLRCCLPDLPLGMKRRLGITR